MAPARRDAEGSRQPTLLPLPPDSLELNPRENIWDYLRGNKLSHQVWNTYEAIVRACAEAWHFLVADPDRILSAVTLFDGALIAEFDGLPASASRVL